MPYSVKRSHDTSKSFESTTIVGVLEGLWLWFLKKISFVLKVPILYTIKIYQSLQRLNFPKFPSIIYLNKFAVLDYRRKKCSHLSRRPDVEKEHASNLSFMVTNAQIARKRTTIQSKLKQAN